jgi:predicted ATP-grasp superfamily ATP-dependent carboligase
VAQSNKKTEVLVLGRQIIQAMGFYGYSCTEFKKDPRDDVYKLMEVNGRHNLSTLLAVNCGLNFPLIHYNHLVEGKLPADYDYRKDVYWIDLFRDLASSIAYVQNGGSLAQFIQPYFSPHVFAVLDTRDPKPFVTRCSYAIKKVLKSSSHPK